MSLPTYRPTDLANGGEVRDKGPEAPLVVAQVLQRVEQQLLVLSDNARRLSQGPPIRWSTNDANQQVPHHWQHQYA